MLSPPLEPEFYAVCFGTFSLYRSGKPLNIPSKKAVELLAFLLSGRGKIVRKTYAAEQLWPESTADHAMDSLYKACGVLRRACGTALPLQISRDALWLDASRIDSDAARFERLYQFRKDIDCCTAAIELYTAPFLINEYYEWSARAEAYYDMRYMELLSLAESHYRACGNRAALRYYRQLGKEFL